MAKVYAKFKMTDDVVQAGRPVITCEVEGADEIYDPRTDTTGYSNNAILAFYWWLALPREEGGFGCYPDEIDWDWVAAEANVCDERVPLKAGGTEPRYTLDGFMATGADPSSVRGILIENMAGRFTYSGGLMLARPGYWVPVSATISEDDLTDAVAYDLLAPGDRRVTEITASWNDPAQLYVADDLPARSIDSDDVAQGSIDLPFVKSRTRGQRIQQIRLRQAAAERTLSVPLNINGLAIAPMDTVMLGTARYASLANTAWTVTNWAISPEFGIPLGLSEENEDMYAWSIDDEIDPGVVPAIDRAELIPEPASSATTAGEVTDGTNTYTPAKIKQLEDRIAALEPQPLP
nr:phage tail protein [uncultured Sphingomonas sp.]